MTVDLDIRFSSDSQEKVFDALADPKYRYFLIRGGAGSGKTFISLRAVAYRAMAFPGSMHYLLKTDKAALKTAFEDSVISWYDEGGFTPSRTRANNRTYFYDRGGTTELHYANGASVFIRPITSPTPEQSSRDAKLHGIHAATLLFDEATAQRYEWFKWADHRVMPQKGCPPVIILTENPDARSWTHLFFDLKVDPETMEPLSQQQIDAQCIMRIEAWENVLNDEATLEIWKNSGNAKRFYYGEVDDSPDYGQIYRYRTAPMPMRMYNIYALDPGYQARTAIVQIGFGGDLVANVRELCYSQGFGNEDFMREVQKIIDLHRSYLTQILASLKPGQDGWLSRMHFIPHLVVDCARVDLIADIDRRFNYGEKGKQIEVIASRKGEAKYYSIERIKKFAIEVDTNSKFLKNEMNHYRYTVTASDDERVPDGQDDLLDAMLYGLRYALEDVYEHTPRALKFDETRKQIYENIKHLPI